MTVLRKLEHALTHPLTAVSAAAGAASAAFPVPILDPIVGSIWSNAGMVFAGASVVSGSLSEQFGLSPTMQTTILLLAGMLWLGRIGERLWTGVERRMNDD